MFFQLLLLCVAVSMDGLGAGFSYGTRNLRIPFLSLLVISLSSALTMGVAMCLGWAFKHCVSLDLARLLGGGILIVLGCWITWQGLSAGLNHSRGSFLKQNKQHIHKGTENNELPAGPVEQKEEQPAGSAKTEERPGGLSAPVIQKAAQNVEPAGTEMQPGKFLHPVKLEPDPPFDPGGRGERFNYLQYLTKIIFEPQEADLDHSGSINLGEAALLGFALACDAFGAGFAAALAGFNLWLTSSVVGLSKFFLISLGLWCGSFFRGRLSALPAHLFSGGLLIFLGLLRIL